jgi:hypothetical protein
MIYWAVVETKKEEALLAQDSAFTTATITNEVYTYKNRVAQYYFHVDGVMYKAGASSKGKKIRIGGKYIVKYYPKDPHIHRIDLTKEVE